MCFINLILGYFNWAIRSNVVLTFFLLTFCFAFQWYSFSNLKTKTTNPQVIYYVFYSSLFIITSVGFTDILFALTLLCIDFILKLLWPSFRQIICPLQLQFLVYSKTKPQTQCLFIIIYIIKNTSKAL